jgi:hypothetical protein
MFHVKHFGTIAFRANGLPQGGGEVRHGDLGRTEECDSIEFWPCNFLEFFFPARPEPGALIL